jgi:thymidylate synthase (FAD)
MDKQIFTKDSIGYVQLVLVSGDEKLIRKIAGISHDSESGPTIYKLLSMNPQHLSPFEFADITFKVKAPIFVARQWFRHRTGTYMEKSLRYCDSNSDFYCSDTLRDEVKDVYEVSCKYSLDIYNSLKRSGVPKELARGVLPFSLYTEFYFKMDLRNLIHFLELRLDNHAQKEIRDYATIILSLLENYFPETCEYILNKNKENT